MTVPAYRPERWEREDGAPQGPSFDLVIPSSREGRGPYRIVCDSVSGVVIHRPTCEAFQHGWRDCRHVRDAIWRSENPAAAFLDDVDRLRLSGNWWTDPKVFAAEVVRLCIDARKREHELRDYRNTAAKPRATLEEAIREFGGAS